MMLAPPQKISCGGWPRGAVVYILQIIDSVQPDVVCASAAYCAMPRLLGFLSVEVKSLPDTAVLAFFCFNNALVQ